MVALVCGLVERSGFDLLGKQKIDDVWIFPEDQNGHSVFALSFGQSFKNLESYRKFVTVSMGEKILSEVWEPNEMTESQKILFSKAVKENMMTDDPCVNWYVDKELTGESVDYDPDMYLEDILLWRKSGGLLLESGN